MFFRKKTIFRKILVPLMLVMVIQSGLIYGVIRFGGTVDQLRANSFAILNETVSSRKKDIENEMVQRWSNVKESVENVQQTTDEVLSSNNKTLKDLTLRAPVTDTLLAQLYPTVTELLRKNSVTGAFVVFNGTDTTQQSDDRQKMGIYLRDADPGYNPSDNSDIMAVRCPPSISKLMNVALDSYWQPYFDLQKTDNASHMDYYFKPYQAATDHPEIGYADLGYWSKPFYLSENDATQIITYSVPLLTDDGTVFGVLGVELSIDYLVKRLPAGEVNADNKGGYVLAVTDTSPEQSTIMPYTCVVKSGSALNYLLDPSDTISFQPDALYESIYRMAGTDHSDPVLGSVSTLKLYNSHTPFENDRWALIGVLDQRTAMSISNQLMRLLIISIVVVLVIGLISIFIAANLITKPIGALAQRLRKSDPTRPIHLGTVNILEVDELSDVLESLSRQVVDSATKLSTILELAGVDIGAFEYDRKTDMVFCTGRLFSVLNRAEVQGDHWVQLDMLKELFAGMIREPEENQSEDRTFILRTTGENPRWIRLKIVESTDRMLGVVVDITAETLEKRKIEHDRDYDLLTNIYNRRAFYHIIHQLFRQPEQLGVAALMMLDLDNLKYVNDTYGHDYGDDYIRCAATALEQGAGEDALVARISGDEFLIFLYGYADKDAARQKMETIRQDVQKASIRLPDSSVLQIRASAGVAWYPDDSDQYDDLVRFADFAMYMVKRTNKGQFTEFNIESYNKESYLLQCKEELNLIIDQSLVTYQFQPIVDAKTGEIFAYEALMRPNTDNISTPAALLSLARSQSKLHDIERLTWFRSMACFKELDIADSSCKLFINSLSNQALTQEEAEQFAQENESYLKRIVLELIEEDQPDEESAQRKFHYIRQWGAELALDDYGTGYNGEKVLIDLNPEYVKLDISLIHHIDTDANRLQIVQYLVAYSHERNIQVIAEGVETPAEMRTLILAGVDYIQGYYVGKPTYQPGDIAPAVRDEIRCIIHQLPADQQD